MARRSRYVEQRVMENASAVWKTAIYGRLSVEDGDDIEQNSIGNQKKIALDFLKDHSDMVLLETFADNGFTGMNFERPGFRSMMEAVFSGRINCIVVKDVSRLGRNFILTSEYVEKTLPGLGVRLVCLGDDYDSEDTQADASALMLPFKMVMNDSYVRDISKKIRSSITTKMEKGEYLPSASSVPYGYIRNAESVTYDVDPEAAAVVLRIYEMRAAGKKFNAIARILNDEGVFSPGRLRYARGMNHAAKNETALWQRGTIRKITQDVVYTGKRVHGKMGREKLSDAKRRMDAETWTVIENAHPAIVSCELFEKVQRVNREELEHRASFQPCAAASTDYREIFEGKLFCAQCGGRMVPAKGCARHNAKTPSRIFYDCSAYKYSNHAVCGSHYIRQETIMRAVRHALDVQIQVAADLDKLIRDVQSMPRVKAYQQENMDALSSIRAKRRGVEEKLERLLVDLTDGRIDREQYAREKARCAAQLGELLQREREAAEKSGTLFQAIDQSRRWLAAVMEYKRLPQVDRRIVAELIDRILVKDSENVIIEMRFADPLAWIGERLSQISGESTYAG